MLKNHSEGGYWGKKPDDYVFEKNMTTICLELSKELDQLGIELNGKSAIVGYQNTAQ